MSEAFIALKKTSRIQSRRCVLQIFFFSTKMSGSRTVNYISSYSILKTLTSFINHCFSCHQWQSRIESFTGCLPKCLFCALENSFLVSIPPIALASKRLSSEHALGKPPQESRVHAKSQPGRTKETCSFARQGERRRGAMVLSSSTTDKRWTSLLYLVRDLSSHGTWETPGPVPFSSVPGSPSEGVSLRLLPFRSEV